MKNMFVEYLYLTLYHKTTSALQMPVNDNKWRKHKCYMAKAPFRQSM